MTLDELLEILDFSKNAIEKKTDKPINIKAIINLTAGKTKHSVCLDIKEIGFDDKSATIYIEV